jgi:hypothetical protein
LSFGLEMSYVTKIPTQSKTYFKAIVAMASATTSNGAHKLFYVTIPIPSHATLKKHRVN